MYIQKISALLLAGAAMLTISACGKKAEPVTQPSSEAAAQVAEYSIYNTTGDTVTELYVYLVGSENKGENLAGDGLADGASIVVNKTAATEEEAKAMTFVVEFVTGGETQKFETLHFEVAPLSLKSVDAASGATPLSFSKPE